MASRLGITNTLTLLAALAGLTMGGLTGLAVLALAIRGLAGRRLTGLATVGVAPAIAIPGKLGLQIPHAGLQRGE